MVVEKVDVLAVSKQSKRFGTAEQVVIRAAGAPPELAVNSVNASNDGTGWWLRRALGVVIDIWRS